MGAVLFLLFSSAPPVEATYALVAASDELVSQVTATDSLTTALVVASHKVTEVSVSVELL